MDTWTLNIDRNAPVANEPIISNTWKLLWFFEALVLFFMAMIRAFSSIILAIPIIIANENKISQNSRFSRAYLKVVCLPFLVMNLSLSLGVPRAFFRASGPIKENEMTGTNKLSAMITSNTRDPQ